MAKKEEKTNKKETSKNKKSFWKDFKAELKKVVWPSPKQLVNNTIAVVTIVLITAAIVFVLDLTFETLNKQGVEKIKQAIESSTAVEETTDESDTDTDVDVTEESVEESSEQNTTESVENVESNTENTAE